ncbi:MAG TPA: DUF1385 domain-containing protein, partial [Candidatus Limnocylindrales bacterium]|nr:DUF1385 domain-containing protein [Candidatus Limnocylindrales bacterium]
EGVLMRGRDAIAVAFRHPDGRIVWASEALDTGPHRWRLAKAPLVRGLIVLYETLVVGTRWLIRSANIQAAGEEGEGAELGGGSVAILLGVTMILGVGFFFVVPLLIAQAVTDNSGSLGQHLIEGLIKVGLFLGYLALVSRAPDIRRVFQYHGAEHMTIHALEAGDPLTTDAVRKYPTAHPRCGTEFLVVLIALSILVFAIIGKQERLVGVVTRIVLIPVLAAVGYELLRWGARHRSNPIVSAIMWPGILVQMITTKRPSDDQIEVAIVSMEQALVADGERVPDGSELFERDRLDPEPAAAPA